MHSKHRDEDLLTIPQAAALLGPVGKPLSRETMDQMIKAGAFPVTRVTGKPNGNITIMRKYLIAHLEANTTTYRTQELEAAA